MKLRMPDELIGRALLIRVQGNAHCNGAVGMDGSGMVEVDFADWFGRPLPVEGASFEVLPEAQPGPSDHEFVAGILTITLGPPEFTDDDRALLAELDAQDLSFPDCLPTLAA